ncbi:YfcC family protein [Actinomyces vulturis]|uniref:YfcC family protein n=1 Tax=Actinomyces vulturis TaxID=1857645 RepID=UPI0008363418|nr:YfcC family protein [Actinomyces vulturis]
MSAAAVAEKGPQGSTKKLNFRAPSAFTILFVLTILAVIATWFVPAGSYSKLVYNADANVIEVSTPAGEVETFEPDQESLDELGVKIDIGEFTSGAIKKPISVPGTYEELESNPASLTSVPQSMVDGTIEAIDIIVFIFVLGGLIGVVRVTGAFESGLMRLTKATKGREFLMVSAVSLFMIIGGTSCGLEEEAVAFYPIIAPIFIAMGYDSIVVVGAIFLAGSIGTCFSTINPFSSAIANNAAGIGLMQGMTWRVIGLIGGTIAVIIYLRWYSSKVKADPTFSYSYDDREAFRDQWQMGGVDDELLPFDWRRKVILILFVAAFPIMVWGVMAGGWWFPTMAASFLTITIVIMFIAGLGKGALANEKMLVDGFSEGAGSLVGVSLIIGLARGINMILNNGLISDTMLYHAADVASKMSGPAFVLVLLFIFFLLGFVVPSSSGLAVLSMPIMAPLADSVGIPRFVVVCAYQWGQYAMLFLAPTGLVMATLQMLDMKYSHWFRFVWPMVVFVLAFGGVLLVIMSLVYG